MPEPLHQWAANDIITSERLNALNDNINAKAEYKWTDDVTRQVGFFSVLPAGIPSSGLYLQVTVKGVQYTFFNPNKTNQCWQITNQQIPVTDSHGNVVNGQVINDEWQQLYGQINV